MATKTKAKTATARDDIDAWAGFAPGMWQDAGQRARVHPAQLHALRGRPRLPARPDRRARKAMWKTLQPLLAKEREKGILGVSQVPSGHPRARGRVTSTRDNETHRRPADRRAARCARSCPSAAGASWQTSLRVLRLRARPGAGRRSSPSTARPTTTACSTPTRRRSARRVRRARHHRPARRLRTRAHHRRLSPGGALRRRLPDGRQGARDGTSSTSAIRPRRSSACARNCPSRSARSRS